MKSLILASGFGTRLYPLTQHKAKALLEYKGQPVINHLIAKIPQDVDILVNVNRKFEADFRRWQRTLARPITLCVEPVSREEEALGAVGSIDYWVKAKNINEDLLVLAADNYFEFSLESFINTYDKKDTLVAVYDIGDKNKAVQFGVVQLKGSRIVSFVEKPAHPESSLVAIACYIFPTRIFPLLFQCCTEGRDNLGNFISYLVEVDKVRAFTFKESWLDIGNLDAYRTIQKAD